ncbi:MAG TPA: spore germination protein GerW family protein [Candidatus Acidoferrum sp.]|nr:spore germination protein GerW family protein [Candidatus Acidoferrum sp.]
MTEHSSAASEILNNLQLMFKSIESFFSNVESVGKPIEIGDVVLIPISTAFFGAGGGGGGGGEQANNGFGFGLGASKSLAALVIVTKDKPGTEGVHIHEFKNGKTGVGEALVEALPKMFEMWQMRGESPLSNEEREKLMNI